LETADDNEAITCPSGFGEVLDVVPPRHLTHRGSPARIRLGCGDADAWPVTTDHRLSWAGTIGQDHLRMTPEPIVFPESVNVMRLLLAVGADTKKATAEARPA
jgi:hypothetical protein